MLAVLSLGSSGCFAGSASDICSDQIGQSRVVEDACGSIANVEKNLVQGAMGKVAVDQFAQLLGVTKRSQRTIDEANNLAQMDVRRVRGAADSRPWRRGRSPPFGRS